MASLPVNCPANTWTPLFLNEKQARIRITLTDPSKYYFDVVPAGDPAPDPAVITGSLFPLHGIDVQFRENVDFYIYAFDRAGRMDVDTDDAPYTDVFVQDQSTPVIIGKFSEIVTSTTLTAEATKDSYTVEVLSNLLIVVGQLITIFSTVTNRFYQGRVLNIAGLTLTLDTPLDSTFPSGASVDLAVTNMAVDGSVTPVVFGLRNQSPGPIDLVADVTRIIWTCVTDTAVDLSKFGDIVGGLTRGLVCRQRNGITNNIFNVKTNKEITAILYDWTPFAATNPAQGQDGFASRLTFGGQSKIGVVVRLNPNEDLEIWVQDDLTTLDTFEITAEGHLVE
jgi:hypothetical protein